MNYTSFQRKVANFFFLAFVVLLGGSLFSNILLINELNSNREITKSIVASNAANIAEIEVLKVELENSKQETKKAQKQLVTQAEKFANQLAYTENLKKLAEKNVEEAKLKLQSAIIPQDNVKDAFSEQVAKPATEAAKNAWNNVSAVAKQTWTYFFN